MSQLPDQSPPAPQPMLLDRVRATARLRHLSLHTEEAYVGWIRRFILFHHKQHPALMAEEEVRSFLSHLAVTEHVAASTQNQALAALLFLYRDVLDSPLIHIDGILRAPRKQKVPVVFTHEEAISVLAQMSGVHRLMAQLLYGSGLRLMECLRLR